MSVGCVNMSVGGVDMSFGGVDMSFGGNHNDTSCGYATGHNAPQCAPCPSFSTRGIWTVV
ncbi:MAG: hypothetical protein LBH80_02025 [Prevotellaceae bacterium]|nr:hypothetical protein [Prevotellaceae bacterium]